MGEEDAAGEVYNSCLSSLSQEDGALRGCATAGAGYIPGIIPRDELGTRRFIWTVTPPPTNNFRPPPHPSPLLFYIIHLTRQNATGTFALGDPVEGLVK
ncbi:hypothetical protein E2C01_053305 [Portunus trituberculatus]|uniref:Uncharacterized protein n=1 Tax=Portunus trituberculatus TaxID=210409 RepID=A0A5B7GQF3_PORTR|nr:hypothetical protein [Portunus trituberculatus]